MNPLILPSLPEAQRDEQEIMRAIEVLFDGTSVVELRAMPTPNGMVSGYFDADHRPQLCESAAGLSGIVGGVYCTLNPVSPDLLARSANRVKPYAKNTASDADIFRRAWLLLDFDPKRPAGISATDAELEAALALAKECRDWLREKGWADPVFALSGNGGHLLYRIDLPNDELAAELVSRVLKAVAFGLDSAMVTVDQSVCNAARISKLYGTLAAKGDHLPERPHRIARMLEIPERREIVRRDQLESLADSVKADRLTSDCRGQVIMPAVPTANGNMIINLESWLAEHSVEVGKSKRWNGGQLWDLKSCPWKPDHKDGGAWVAQLADWQVLAGCHHSSCQDNGWPELRDVFEPGWRDGATAANEADDDPHRLAKLYLNQRCHHKDGFTLRFWNGCWHRWIDGAWRAVQRDDITAELTQSIKRDFDRLWLEASNRGEKPAAARKVTTAVVNNTLGAVRSLTLIPSTVEQPAWLEACGQWEAKDVLATRNALVHLPSLVADTDCIREPTPNFFSPMALDYDFDPDATAPTHWLKFLSALWPDDLESIETLQEFMGYFLVADTRQQKIMMFIGPPRSGKSTITNVIKSLVGPANVAGTTLATLATQFGLSSLIGKTLAIIPDARLSGRTDSARVVELLLSISGEDFLTIDRKNRDLLNCKLPVRIVIVSNEMPSLPDASGALASRMILLVLTESWLGKEDTELSKKLLAELPGILLWSIEGWRRLKVRGRFIQPASGSDRLTDFGQLSSPVSAFLEDCCELGPSKEVPSKDLYSAFAVWAETNGLPCEPAPIFGKHLFALIPTLRRGQRRIKEKKVRVYFGLQLRT